MPCFWCHDADAHGAFVVTTYRPCAACQTLFKDSILAFEVDMADKLEQPEMLNGLAPTGRYALCKPGLIDRWNVSEEHKRQIKAAGKVMLEERVFEALINTARSA